MRDWHDRELLLLLLLLLLLQQLSVLCPFVGMQVELCSACACCLALSWQPSSSFPSHQWLSQR
jgi:hypothetical protein